MVKNLAYWLEWIRAYHDQATEYSLDNVSLIARQLNLTSFDVPVIVVGGTNGKGSCVASMEAILLAHGYRVGAFTSPHLYHFNERIRINGVNISDAMICSIMPILYDCLANNKFIPLRFFDYAMLIALQAFKQSALDYIILEVGLGGRLDAVNVVQHAISVITSVSLDHCEWLGNNCEAIAREKAGIVHKGGCLIYAEENLPKSVAGVVFEQHAQLLQYGKDYFCTEELNSWGWRKGCLEFLNLPKLTFPVTNAAAAICALSLIPNLRMKQSILQQVFFKLKVPGRLQIEKYCGRELVFDVAHNPAAVAWLSSKVQSMPCAGKTVVLLAIAATKDYVSMLQVWQCQTDNWLLCAVQSMRRAVTLESLTSAVRDVHDGMIEEFSDAANALEHAFQLTQSGDRIVVFGSFHTVAKVLEELKQVRDHGRT